MRHNDKDCYENIESRASVSKDARYQKLHRMHCPTRGSAIVSAVPVRPRGAETPACRAMSTNEQLHARAACKAM